jgi:hypothetical protein
MGREWPIAKTSDGSNAAMTHHTTSSYLDFDGAVQDRHGLSSPERIQTNMDSVTKMLKTLLVAVKPSAKILLFPRLSMMGIAFHRKTKLLKRFESFCAQLKISQKVWVSKR